MPEFSLFTSTPFCSATPPLNVERGGRCRTGRMAIPATAPTSFRVCARVSRGEFPPFLPKEVEMIRDPPARELAKRIQRLPVNVSFLKSSLASSCVKPRKHNGSEITEPLVLLHGFDSSCLEWRYTYPLLEDAGTETWALDILGWGFSDLENLPPCNVAAKREHLYQFWRSYIERPMVLVGSSLGAAVAIDFAANHPEAVAKLVLIDASVYAEGTGNMRTLPKAMAYAGVAVLKSFPLRLFANSLTFGKMSFFTSVDWTKVGRLHCLLPWWEDATVDFMLSGGYDVIHQIKQIKHQTLIIWGEDDQIISNTLAQRLHEDLPNSVLHQIPECGHLPHVEKPKFVAELILEFLQRDHSLRTIYAHPQIASTPVGNHNRGTSNCEVRKRNIRSNTTTYRA